MEVPLLPLLLQSHPMLASQPLSLVASATQLGRGIWRVVQAGQLQLPQDTTVPSQRPAHQGTDRQLMSSWHAALTLGASDSSLRVLLVLGQGGKWKALHQRAQDLSLQLATFALWRLRGQRQAQLMVLSSFATGHPPTVGQMESVKTQTDSHLPEAR
jgi:hypothetical protein